MTGAINPALLLADWIESRVLIGCLWQELWSLLPYWLIEYNSGCWLAVCVRSPLLLRPFSHLYLSRILDQLQRWLQSEFLANKVISLWIIKREKMIFFLHFFNVVEYNQSKTSLKLWRHHTILGEYFLPTTSPSRFLHFSFFNLIQFIFNLKKNNFAWKFAHHTSWLIDWSHNWLITDVCSLFTSLRNYRYEISSYSFIYTG